MSRYGRFGWQMLSMPRSPGVTRPGSQRGEAAAVSVPSLLDINGVAARLGVNVRHVRRLVAERRIPYLKWGRLLRFDPRELADWIEASRTECRRF